MDCRETSLKKQLDQTHTNPKALGCMFPPGWDMCCYCTEWHWTCSPYKGHTLFSTAWKLLINSTFLTASKEEKKKKLGKNTLLRDLETSAVIMGRQLDSRLLQEKGPLNTWDEAPPPRHRYSVLSWQHQGHLNSQQPLLAVASHKLVLSEKPCGRVVGATLWSFSMTSSGPLTLLLPDCPKPHRLPL